MSDKTQAPQRPPDRLKECKTLINCESRKMTMRMPPNRTFIRGKSRIPVLSLARRKRFRIPVEVRALDIKPQLRRRSDAWALRRYPTWTAILDIVERLVQAHGQIPAQKRLDRATQTALEAFGGADFVRKKVGLPQSHVGVGRDRKDPDVLRDDFIRITSGRTRLKRQQVQNRRGGGGILTSARKRGGLGFLRLLAGAPEGRKAGSRSLRVPANFRPRLAAMMAHMRETGTITQAGLGSAGFDDVLNALSHHEMTLTDIQLRVSAKPSKRRGKHSLRIVSNFAREVTPYLGVDGFIDYPKLRTRQDLQRAIVGLGGVRAANLALIRFREERARQRAGQGSQNA